MRPSLAGRVALVTGGTRGIGRGIALRLARDGADCAITYRTRAALAEEVAAEIEAMGRRALPLALALDDPAQVPDALGKVAETFGRLDSLVANAAATAFRPILEQKPYNLQKTFAISVDSFVAAVAGGRPVDVAYLASDSAAFLTGQTILLDGGLTIASPLQRLVEGP